MAGYFLDCIVFLKYILRGNHNFLRSVGWLTVLPIREGLYNKMNQSEIEKNTKLLRTDSDSFWVRLRQLLSEKGVNPELAFLAYSYEEDYQFDYGIVVSHDGRVFQYGFDFLLKDVSEGIFTEWNDMTNQYQRSPYVKEIEIALHMAGENKGSAG